MINRAAMIGVSGRWLVAGLLGLLAVQASMIAGRTTRDIKYQSLAVGEHLPFSVSGWPPHAASDRNPTISRCNIAFICSTGCAACSALADRYAEETRSSRSGVRPIWLMGGDSARVASWAVEHGLPRERVLALAVKEGRFWRPHVYGDIWSTPTRVVLTSKLIVRDARPADALLNHEELQSLCESGGIAPQGLEELKDLLGKDGG